MTTGYVYDPIYLEHDMPGHPESKERLLWILNHLHQSGLLPALTPVPAKSVSLDLLRHVHAESYCQQVERLAARGGGFLDPDTYVGPRSYEVALMAAGGLVEAVAAVLDGKLRNAFALVRPPGHHALHSRGMGFCLFNNVAVAARYALNERGLKRILIVDFDVHHGNGTQEAFYETSEVLYFSTHQYPHYPGTGHWRETGAGPGEGYTANVPLPPGVGDAGFQMVFEELLRPLAARYRPELLLVSAGYDAHWDDPLASLHLSLAGYARLCRILYTIANEWCAGRLVFTLEGGYHLSVLAHGVANTFRVLLGRGDEITDPFGPSPHAERPIADLVMRLKEAWHLTAANA